VAATLVGANELAEKASKLNFELRSSNFEMKSMAPFPKFESSKFAVRRSQFEVDELRSLAAF
jgi:hypothetical protein